MRPGGEACSDARQSSLTRKIVGRLGEAFTFDVRNGRRSDELTGGFAPCERYSFALAYPIRYVWRVPA